MADYDQLHQVESWVSDETNPVYKEIVKAIEPYQSQIRAKAAKLMKAQGGKLEEKQRAALFKEYQAAGAAKTLEVIQKKLGGKIPDQKEAQEFDYSRRVKTATSAPDFNGDTKAAEAAIREGDAPYSRAYATIGSLQSLLPKPSPTQEKAKAAQKARAPAPVEAPAAEPMPAPVAQAAPEPMPVEQPPPAPVAPLAQPQPMIGQMPQPEQQKPLAMLLAGN